MKRVVAILTLFFVLLCFSAYAQAPNYFKTSFDKAKHGVVNTLTGFLEVPFQVKKGWDSGFGDEGKNKFLGGFFGIFRGIYQGVGRTLTGALQLGTFFLPNPRENDGVGIPLDSEYVWQEGQQYSIVNEEIAPIGRKALRGGINTVFGMLDLPGQLVKGFNQGKPLMGICKAIAFPIGRVVSGAVDIATVFFPNDTVGYGYPLEEKNPWDAFAEENYDNDL